MLFVMLFMITTKFNFRVRLSTDWTQRSLARHSSRHVLEPSEVDAGSQRLVGPSKFCKGPLEAGLRPSETNARLGPQKPMGPLEADLGPRGLEWGIQNHMKVKSAALDS